MGQHIVPDLDRFVPACGPARLGESVVAGEAVIPSEQSVPFRVPDARPADCNTFAVLEDMLTVVALRMESDTD